MTRCLSCSAELLDGARFCAGCGKPVVSAGGAGERGPEVSDATATVGSTSWSASASSIDGRFAPGTMLADRYRIVGRLGQGGMGEVYRADDMRLGQPVALKFLPENFTGGSNLLSRFHHEVKIARQVSHPNVCRVYDIAEYQGQHFLSMEYVDGEDLKSLLRRIGRLPGDKALQIARQLCAGLAAAHEKGVLHRDLKPANVMLDGSGRVRITDFGLAAVAGEVAQNDLRTGTPAYMAPEQREGREVSVASDIYALGLVLFELFTGQAAFQAETKAELDEKQRLDVTSPSSLVQEIDPVVERVILGCLARHPAERPSSALAVAAALPGGDPLAAALAAGETPSPEMVAASVVKGGLSAPLAWATLVGVLALAAALFLLAETGKVTSYVSLPKAPQVLVSEAREILAAAGYEQEPADHIWGFERNSAALEHLGERETADRWKALGGRERSSVFFYYRQSPAPLFPLNPISNRMFLRDPPATTPGMATVWMDTEGSLIRMEVLPPEKSEPPSGPSDEEVWRPLFDSAGLDPEATRPAEPAWNPPFFSDRQVAWERGAAGENQQGARVEAASYRGSPSFFRVLAPWDEPFEPSAQFMSTGERLAQAGFMAIALGLLIGGALLARRNIRLGRSDRRGASRIAGVFAALHMLAWLLYAKHPPDLGAAFFAMMMTLAYTALESLIIFTFYLALEPYVRRRWPDTIVSWTRALTGRFRDPLVGRDILFGCGLGLAMALLMKFGQLAPGWFGEPPREPGRVNLHALAANRFAFGELLDNIVHAILPAMGVLVLLLFLLLIAKRAWIAGLVGTLVLLGLNAPGIEHWFDVFGMLATAGLVVFSLVRLGLLSTTVLFAVARSVDDMVISSDLSVWWAAGTILALAFTLALAALGFYVALAGRPLFGTGWLEK